MSFNFQYISVTKKTTERFWEIDFLRGIAVIGMIIFHGLYDLNYFNIYKLELYSGFLLLLAYSIGSIFILLVGMSLTLSYAKARKTMTGYTVKVKYLKRGVMIFGLGLLITLATWLYLDEGFIVFGVLHCIGISIILAYPFLHFRFLNLIGGIICIVVGILLKPLTFEFYWLVWLGFRPSHFYSVDYYPLLPWLGVVLLGIFIGNLLYPNYKRIFKLQDLSRFRCIRSLAFLGRHSLIVYFLHQPILIGIICLFLL